jgi:uncharacterized membrane protein HdeD (DUF308 family)
VRAAKLSTQKGGFMLSVFTIPAIPALVMAILAIVFGIIILIWPHVLSYLIAIYLIIVGIIYFVSRFAM